MKFLKHIVIFSVVFLNLQLTYADHLVVKGRHGLSSSGDDFAARYEQTNKIVTANGKTHFAWLEADLDVKYRTYDHSLQSWETITKLGRAQDNHGGPALAIDPVGKLHTFFGPHGGLFEYFKSSTSWESSDWEGQASFGEVATYPSVAIDRNNTIHIAYRGKLDTESHKDSVPLKLIYQYKKEGQPWSQPQLVASPCLENTDELYKPVDEYAHYHHSLTISENGELHLLYDIYFKSKLMYVGPRARWIGYLKKSILDDNGTWNYSNEWKTLSGNAHPLPISPASPGDAFVKVVSTSSDLALTVSGVALDSRGRPWFTLREETFKAETCYEDPVTGYLTPDECDVTHRDYILYHHNGTSWEHWDLFQLLPSGLNNPKISNILPISIDANDNLYIAGVINSSVMVLYKNIHSPAPLFNTLVVAPEMVDRQYNHVNIERPTNQNKIGMPWLLFSFDSPLEGGGEDDRGPDNVEAAQLGY
mgnify:CR=1 FL=1